MGESGGAGALVAPQYGIGKHTHAVAGGGTKTHEHAGAKPGHGHDDVDGVALLPLPKGALSKAADVPDAKGFLLDFAFDVKSAEQGDPPGTLTLTGYANTWAQDRDDERFVRTAFDESLGEYLLNPVLLYGHDDGRQIGHVADVSFDHIGVKVVAKVPPPPPGSEPWHVKVYHDIKNRTLRAMSVGGVFLRDRAQKTIEKIRWYETSVVSVQSNQYSIFDVAEAKGLRWPDEKAKVQQPGVGRGHGAHHHGGLAPRAVHTHGNGVRHSHPGGTKSHAHGVHAHTARNGPAVQHRHGASVAGHTHGQMGAATSITPGPHYSTVAHKAVDTPEQEVEEQAARGDLGELMQGLLEALSEVIDRDDLAEPEKVANVKTILSDFVDEAQDRMGTDEDVPDDEQPAKWLAALVSTKASTATARRIKAIIEETHMGDETVTTTNTANGTAAPAEQTVDTKSYNAVLSRLDTLERERKELDLEKKAAQMAQERIEAEAKAEKEAKAAKAAEDARLEEMVTKALSTARTGRKYLYPVSDTKAPGANGDPRREFATWLRDLKNSRRGDWEAYQRLQSQAEETAGELGVKAMVGTTTGAGGFLVPPQYWQQGLAEFRIAASKLRPLMTIVPEVNTNLVYIPRETGINAVGWTSENATKPSTDQTFGQIAINLFTLAGISKVSNQLLDDSSPAVDAIVRKDLGRTIGQAEDIAIIDGTGVGQPTGILRTTGVLTVAYTDPGARLGSGLGDAISAAINAIQTNYFGDPSAIVAHPRNVDKLRRVKDSSGRYIFEPGYNMMATPQMGNNATFMGGAAQAPGAVGTIWGLPVIADANVPTNYSGTTPGGGAESPIIVADFAEAYLFERKGFSIDVSSEAGTAFETNQCWFRGEERLGASAARQPTAFSFITGLGAAING